MCTYQIHIDERTAEGKQIKKFLLKFGAVKVATPKGDSLCGMSYDYRKELDEAIKAAEKEPKMYFNSIADLERMGL